MKKSINRELLSKGIFALAAIAIVGTTTAAYAVTNSTDNSTSGYGNSGEVAIAASQEFDAAFARLSSDFNTDIDAYVATAKAELTGEGAEAADDFQSQFDAHSSTLNSTVAAASDKFRSDVVSALGSGASKDQFIDAFNRAKAEYFNSLDAAKNEFAAVTSNLGHESNVTKDQFMNGFNSTRDMFGNDLEGIKNTFADKVSNA